MHSTMNEQYCHLSEDVSGETHRRLLKTDLEDRSRHPDIAISFPQGNLLTTMGLPWLNTAQKHRLRTVVRFQRSSQPAQASDIVSLSRRVSPEAWATSPGPASHSE
eukprot:1930235-Pyramimonas_sp.AAC.1